MCQNKTSKKDRNREVSYWRGSILVLGAHIKDEEFVAG